MSFVFPFTRFIALKIKYAWHGRKSWSTQGASLVRPAYNDDVVVFGIFLAVRPPPQRSASFLKG